MKEDIKEKEKKLLLRSQRLDAARDVAWPSRDKSPGEKWPRPTRAIKSQSRNDPPVMALRHVTSSDNGPDHERERGDRGRVNVLSFKKVFSYPPRMEEHKKEIRKKSSTWGKKGKKKTKKKNS